MFVRLIFAIVMLALVAGTPGCALFQKERPRALTVQEWMGQERMKP